MKYKNRNTGDVVETKGKSARLERLDNWERVGKADGENLSKLSREQLDARAKELGVEDPEELDNKGAVIEAIEAKRDA